MSTPHPEPPEVEPGRHRRPGWSPSRAQRAWLYAVAIAALPILTAYGLLSEDQAPLWATLLAAVLTAGPPALARAHLNPREDDGRA